MAEHSYLIKDKTSLQNRDFISNNSTQKLIQIQKSQETLKKWHNNAVAPHHSKILGIQYEKHFLSMQRSLRFYDKNVYILNRQALKIQHWFFKKISQQTIKVGQGNQDAQNALNEEIKKVQEKLNELQIQEQRQRQEQQQSVIQVRKKSPYKHQHSHQHSPDKVLSIERVEQILTPNSIINPSQIHYSTQKLQNLQAQQTEQESSQNTPQQAKGQPIEVKSQSIFKDIRATNMPKKNEKDSVRFVINSNHQSLSSFVRNEITPSINLVNREQQQNANAQNHNTGIKPYQSMQQLSSVNSNLINYRSSFDETNIQSILKKVGNHNESLRQSYIQPYIKEDFKQKVATNKIEKLMQTTSDLDNLKKIIIDSQISKDKSMTTEILNHQQLENQDTDIQTKDIQIVPRNTFNSVGNFSTQQSKISIKKSGIKISANMIKGPSRNINGRLFSSESSPDLKSRGNNSQKRNINSQIQSLTNLHNQQDGQKKVEAIIDQYKNGAPSSNIKCNSERKRINISQDRQKNMSKSRNNADQQTPLQQKKSKNEAVVSKTQCNQASTVKENSKWNTSSRIYQETQSIKAKYGSRNNSNEKHLRTGSLSNRSPTGQNDKKTASFNVKGMTKSSTITNLKSNNKQDSSRNQATTSVDFSKTQERNRTTRQSFDSQTSLRVIQQYTQPRQSQDERKSSSSIIEFEHEQEEKGCLVAQEITIVPKPMSKPYINPIWTVNSVIKEELIEFSQSQQKEDESDIQLRHAINIQQDVKDEVRINMKFEESVFNKPQELQDILLLRDQEDSRVEDPKDIFNESMKSSQHILHPNDSPPRNQSPSMSGGMKYIESPSIESNSNFSMHLTDLDRTPVQQQYQNAIEQVSKHQMLFQNELASDSVQKNEEVEKILGPINKLLERYNFSPPTSDVKPAPKKKNEYKRSTILHNNQAYSDNKLQRNPSQDQTSDIKNSSQVKLENQSSASKSVYRSATQTVKNLFQSGAISIKMSPQKQQTHQRIIEIKNLDDSSDEGKSSNLDDELEGKKLVYKFNS